MERMMRVAFPALILALLAPAAGASQTLDRVDEFMREGRFQDARDELTAWENGNRSPGREERQRGLWLKGVLTLDPEEAGILYRQLVLEYPGGSFTDQALLRLGTAAALQGNLMEAEANFSLLERDYPGSPARLEAVEWLGRNRAAVDSARAAQARRPAVLPRSDREPAPRPSSTAVRPADSRDFAAQAGAFTEPDRAQALAGRLREAGFEARVVQVEGSDFYRVRVGRFATADEARAMMDRLRAAGFEAGLGTGVTRERPVR